MEDPTLVLYVSVKLPENESGVLEWLVVCRPPVQTTPNGRMYLSHTHVFYSTIYIHTYMWVRSKREGGRKIFDMTLFQERRGEDSHSLVGCLRISDSLLPLCVLDSST